jgi:hypothetical protein
VDRYDPFDPEALRLPEDQAAKPVVSRKPPRHRPGERFVKGPIPLAWLERAARLPGKALAVGMVLWYKAGLTRGRCVPLCLSHGADMGVGPDATRRGLRALGRAGLVSVRSAPGRCSEVTLLDTGNAGRETGHG